MEDVQVHALKDAGGGKRAGRGLSRIGMHQIRGLALHRASICLECELNAAYLYLLSRASELLPMRRWKALEEGEASGLAR